MRGAWTKDGWSERLRHIGYAGGWKKLEPAWDWVIRARRVGRLLPALETLLAGFGRHAPGDRNSEGANPSLATNYTNLTNE